MEFTAECGGVGYGGGASPALGPAATIEAPPEGLSRSDTFHVVKDVIGFVLYMHHQIPESLQNLEDEYKSLTEEYSQMAAVTPSTELKTSSQRVHNMRKRETKQRIKRLEKLMHSISCLLSSLQKALDELPCIQELALVLGGSPARPHLVYEVVFACSMMCSGQTVDYTKTRKADILSRKAIRAMISRGEGSSSYAGPLKLFLFIRTPSCNIPLDFLPKREFRYGKKILPFRLNINRRHHVQTVDDLDQADKIWFQCRHTIKGLPERNPLTEC